jgi:hypothetical protein
MAGSPSQTSVGRCMELLTFVAAVAGFLAWREGRRTRMAVPVKDASRSAGTYGVVSSTQSAEITSRSNRSGMRRIAVRLAERSD